MKSKKKLIAENKEYKSLMKKAKSDIIPKTCLLCGKKMSAPCYSHIIPRFILENISFNGNVFYSGILYGDNVDLHKKGIKNALIFRLICNKCDNELFKNYESLESTECFDEFDFLKKQDILRTMAIKSHLSHIFMKNSVNQFMKNLFIEFKPLFENNARTLDIKNHNDYILKLKKQNDSRNFKIIFNELLDYRSLIACQTLLWVKVDLKKKVVFKSNIITEKNSPKYLYLSVFPLKEKTRILLYIEEKEIGYNKSFIEDFEKLSDKDKVHLISIILMIYSEQFFMHPILKDVILKDKKICKLYNINDSSITDERIYKKITNFKRYNNYLSFEYSNENMNKN